MFAKLRQIPSTILALIVVVGPVLPSAAVAQAAPNVIRVTTTEDEYKRNRQCSLREAVYAASYNVKVDSCGKGGEVDEIVLASGHYVLNRIGTGENGGLTGDLDLSGSITISGASSATTIIDGNQTDRVFEIASGNITLNNLTIQHGLAPYIGGAIYLHDGTLKVN